MKRAIFIFLVALLPLMLINIANENLVLMYETRDSRANIEPIDSLGKNSGIFSNTKSNNWAIQAVDDRGDYLSMAIDNNGNLHVSYCDFSNYDIKYAYFDGNQWHKNTVDSMNADEPALPHGRYVSIAVDNENRPHISYFDYENWTLKYAQYNGNQWHREYVDLAGNIGFDSSIAVDDNNNIHIAYKGGQTQGNLKYAHHNNTGWHIETVDRSERIGEWASIALNSSHNPHISYYDFPNGNLKHAYHNGSGWHNETVDWIGDVGDYSSMVIDDNDSIHISYSNNSAMKYAYYNGNRWRNETVDPHGYVGLYTSIALDPNNRPHISYYTSDRLKYTYYDGASWYNETVDSDGRHDCGTSIVVDSNSQCHIIYSDNSFLKYAFIDNELPVFQEDLSDVPTTGDLFTFLINASDNTGINEAYVIHTFNDIYFHNWSMSFTDERRWEKNVMIPNNATFVKFRFDIKDTVGNWNSTDWIQKDVLDNDAPSLDVDESPNTGTTGDTFEFNISVSDNLKVDRVFIDWTHGVLNGVNHLIETNGFWIGETILDHSIDRLMYTIFVNDTKNEKIGSLQSIPVTDNDKPVAIAGEDQSIDQYKMLIFNGNQSSDNIGVENYTWTFEYNGTNHALYGNMAIFTFNLPGTYNVTLTVKDKAGIEAKDFLNVTVQDLGDYTAPNADAGIDIDADQNGNVILDGSGSTDNVDIINYTWTFRYKNVNWTLFGSKVIFKFEESGVFNVTLTVKDAAGNAHTDWVLVNVKDSNPTDLNSNDSDQDGYNDTYENESGSDPYDANSTPDDRDGDGYSNIEEDGSGSDPDNAKSTPLDWDGDGVPNDEDDYPYDSLASKRKAKEEKDYRVIVIFIGIGFLLSIMASAIYTRMKRNKIMENKTRNAIYTYINRNPGVHYRKVKGKLRISDSTLTHHVRKLREAEMIQVEYKGNFKFFYPIRMEKEPHPLTPMQKKILSVIREKTSSTIQHLASELEKKPRTIRYHVNNLADMEVIDSKNIGNQTHWFDKEGRMKKYVSNEKLP